MSEEEQEIIPLSDWLDCFSQAMKETVETALGMSGWKTLGASPGEQDSMMAFVGLVGDQNAVQLAVAVEPKVGASIAATLLGMEPEEAEELSPEDVTDGIGELMNIVAGVAKRIANNRDGSLKIGLPLVVHGHLGNAKSQDVSTLAAEFEGVSVTLVVLMGDVSAAVIPAKSAA